MPIFDGENLLITLDAPNAGVLNVNVEPGLYSSWKEWVQIGDNAKYPIAFRSVGGDPLTPGIDAGAYFFIQNQSGWRIKPFEADATITLVGNLAPEDSTIPIFNPTDGDYTVFVNGLQPITQNVDTILQQAQETSYNGEVWLDTINGASGVGYPIGTASEPVDNLDDALTIAEQIGVRRLRLTGSIILDRDLQYWVIRGSSGESLINLNGKTLDGTINQRAEVYGGIALTNPKDRVVFEECFLRSEGVSGVRGIIIDCYLFGEVTLSGATEFNRCHSGVAGVNTPAINCNNLASSSLSVRTYTGGLELLNISEPDFDASIDLMSGHLILDSTVSDGTVVIRGVGHITDNSTGSAQKVTKGFVEGGLVSAAASITRNKVITDPVAGTITVYEDDGTTILYQADLWEDADGTQRYRGQGAERRERLT